MPVISTAVTAKAVIRVRFIGSFLYPRSQAPPEGVSELHPRSCLFSGLLAARCSPSFPGFAGKLGKPQRAIPRYPQAPPENALPGRLCLPGKMRGKASRKARSQAEPGNEKNLLLRRERED